jgi:hypothetical protein
VLTILKRDAAPEGLRIGGERSGTREWSAQEGPRNTGLFWLRGTSVPEAGPERPKDQRTFGPRSRVDRSGSSKEGAVRWKATPELVSQDREAGTKPFTGRDQVDRTPAYPSLGAVGAGSNAGPHFFWAKRRKHFFQQAKELRPTEGSSQAKELRPTEGSSGKRRSSGQRRKHFFWGKKSPLSAADFARAFHSASISPRQSLNLSASVSPNQSLRVSLSASASLAAAEAFAEASSDERAAFAAAMLTESHFRRDCSFARSLPRGERSCPRPERILAVGRLAPPFGECPPRFRSPAPTGH